MLKRLALVTATIVFAFGAAGQEAKKKTMLVIHGGAGTITRQSMSAEVEKQYRDALALALKTGHAVLAKGGSSLDAVEATIRVMEDSPLFNAGKGAVFTHDGKNELDASIMDGRTKAAGSVAGVSIIRNPITAARAVMEKSEHVMMVGRGAELFATKMGLEIVDPSYFWTERRWKALQQELQKEKPQAVLDFAPLDEPKKFGTVGAVALDVHGNLAAGTSTGGMTNKQYGRVGDAPIIGAGTYAENESCAVSATGHGEFFIRWTVAYDIAALVKYRGMSVQAAGDEVIHKKLEPVKGEGGVIILDRNGNFATPFNSEGMYRGHIGGDGVAHVEIYKD
ncbi:MAG: L-asparaginase / beta-aspartyl-peptidase [Acidobacteriota bacterium]|jgi:beta-aspartyl-peptidase (threonine type)|nr:L-asparaginase / beta-aspartyl-peptidase [Acidobacteriota bacterium]